jgi:hypothetical protein
MSGQFIVQLADDVADANAAGEVLVSEVQAAMLAAAPFVSNGVVTAASHQASSFKVLRTLGGSSSSDEPVAPAAAAAAAAGVGAAGSAAAPPPKSLLISAPDSAVEFMKASSVVKAVVKDRVVASQQTAGCVERTWLQKGITATPLSGFTWPGCITSRSKLIWRGSACSGGKISYIEIKSIDRVTNAQIMYNRAPCVLSLSAANAQGATYVRQRFGSW